MVAAGGPLNALEFFAALFGLAAYHFAFYRLSGLLLKGHARSFPACAWFYGQGLGLLAAFFWALSGKAAVFPLAYSLALLVAWGYTLVDAAFRLVSPRYRRHPEFFLDAMKEVTLPRGAEVIYAGLERFRERALCLPSKTGGTKAFLLAPLLVFPWSLLVAVGLADALELGVEGLLAGFVLALFGFSVDLAAALMRYRWI